MCTIYKCVCTLERKRLWMREILLSYSVWTHFYCVWVKFSSSSLPLTLILCCVTLHCLCCWNLFKQSKHSHTIQLLVLLWLKQEWIKLVLVRQYRQKLISCLKILKLGGKGGGTMFLSQWFSLSGVNWVLHSLSGLQYMLWLFHVAVHSAEGERFIRTKETKQHGYC